MATSIQRWLAPSLVVLLAACSGDNAEAALLFTYPSGIGADNLGPLVAGSEFTVGVAPVTISRLGVFDQNRDGLNTSHDVGIYDSIGTLVASVNVPAGTVADLIEDWRFADLSSPVSLDGGATYRIAANFATGDPPGDDLNAFNLGAVNPVLGSGIASFTPGEVFASSPTLTYPNQSGPNTRFNANAVLVSSPVPEPSTLAVFALGGIGIVAGGIRRRRKQAV